MNVVTCNWDVCAQKFSNPLTVYHDIWYDLYTTRSHSDFVPINILQEYYVNFWTGSETETLKYYLTNVRNHNNVIYANKRISNCILLIFSAFYEISRLMFTEAHHRSQSWTGWVHCMSSYITSPKHNLMLPFYQHLGLPKRFWVLELKFFIHFWFSVLL